jgi:hypothetical protein
MGYERRSNMGLCDYGYCDVEEQGGVLGAAPMTRPLRRRVPASRVVRPARRRRTAVTRATHGNLRVNLVDGVTMAGASRTDPNLGVRISKVSASGGWEPYGEYHYAANTASGLFSAGGMRMPVGRYRLVPWRLCAEGTGFFSRDAGVAREAVVTGTGVAHANVVVRSC